MEVEKNAVGSENPLAIAVDVDPRMSHAQRVQQARKVVRAFAEKVGIEHLPDSFFSNMGAAERKCLNCDEMHNDPRGFCSAQCCKDHSSRKTAERKELAKNGIKNTRTRNRRKRR